MSKDYRAHALLRQTDLGRYEFVKPYLASALSDIYSKNILPDYYNNADSVKTSKYIYVKRDGAATKVSIDELYTLTSAREELRNVLREVC